MEKDQFLKILSVCARECEIQSVGPKELNNLVKAWFLALDFYEHIDTTLTPDMLIELARVIEPEKCAYGYRKMNLLFPKDAVDSTNISHNVKQILLYTEDPMVLYIELMKIHPFLDGNGRVGLIAFNWLKGSLQYPFFSPEINWEEPYDYVYA